MFEVIESPRRLASDRFTLQWSNALLGFICASPAAKTTQTEIWPGLCDMVTQTKLRLVSMMGVDAGR